MGGSFQICEAANSQRQDRHTTYHVDDQFVRNDIEDEYDNESTGAVSDNENEN